MPASPPNGITVLVVEDHPAVLRMLEIALPHHGFAVLLARGGEEAVALYERRRAEIDVVLMDAKLAGPNEPETLAALRRLNPEVRCCLMSGSAGRWQIEELRAMGAAHVLGKPFVLKELARVLRELVAGGR